MTAFGTRLMYMSLVSYLIFVSSCTCAHSLRNEQDGGDDSTGGGGNGDGCVAGSSGCQGETGGADALGGSPGTGGSAGEGQGGSGGMGGEPATGGSGADAGKSGAGGGGAEAGEGGQSGAGTGGECVTNSDCVGSDSKDYDPCCGCVPECVYGTCRVICHDHGCCYSTGCDSACEALPLATATCRQERIVPVTCDTSPPDCPMGTFPASDGECWTGKCLDCITGCQNDSDCVGVKVCGCGYHEGCGWAETVYQLESETDPCIVAISEDCPTQCPIESCPDSCEDDADDRCCSYCDPPDSARCEDDVCVEVLTHHCA